MPDTASEPARRAARRPRWTVRLRLTLLYGALFLASGAALLALTYALVARGDAAKGVLVTVGSEPAGGQGDPDIRHVANERHEAALQALLAQSGIALALMTAASVGLGWVMAGRVLRPVRVMAGRARRISEHNLHARLAVTGPDDELKDLGDTFDGLLSRLDAAFEAQRRFVANASHELRTPLTLQRAMVEVALSRPGADAASLRAVCERVVAAGEEQERLIEALLTLAGGQSGLMAAEPVDLARVARYVLHDRRPAAPGELDLHSSLRPAVTSGDGRLIARLAGNLVENALRYTPAGGWVRVSTGVGEAGYPLLRVVNSGPRIPAERIPGLYEPFQRLQPRAAGGGHGLGLSIVGAVAAAHRAEVTTVPGPEGGLAVTVEFPPPDPPDQPDPPDSPGPPDR
ncbi:ATP-binding protein [Streptomyces sp. WMMC500]|uniref:sensor histidine kinase n=1 Tax=Streptomyces sp. WMMC500 TaxID=3015154 RepID=UPI00248D34FB|nr:ATP-binding protein [Streptomyces sp. WMMC500]WBB61404.1 ATP-binding protein [Streptomyces sp. WMMC500]